MSSTQTEAATVSPSHVQLQSEPAGASVLNWKIASTTPLHHIPTFTDKYAERQWAKQHMAAAFRTFARLGWADGASGHISLRDPVNPENFWINPYAVHFALMKASDLVLVDHAGRPVEPTKHKVNAAGFIIHSSIHRARPDINAAVHMHSPAGRAWSAFGKGIEMVNQGESLHFVSERICPLLGFSDDRRRLYVLPQSRCVRELWRCRPRRRRGYSPCQCPWQRQAASHPAKPWVRLQRSVSSSATIWADCDAGS
jgi:hypothetical protein